MSSVPWRHAAPTALLLIGVLSACGSPTGDGIGSASAADVAAARERMVTEQIAARGVTDPAVLRAMRAVPRHEFVPRAVRADAYDDRPLPIGEGQTISQPYIVALMTELASVRRGDRVLEVGTGSGYQAAVLAELGAQVYSIEIVEPLARDAAERLRRLGYGAVRVRHGDGYRGWPEAAPFAAILVTAAPPEVPPALLEQLALGGRLVIPVGTDDQDLRLLVRTPTGVETRRIVPVRFVPMVGGP
jgi:protein-L-isoaspartate(D-aspartate) O-methyltransferase